MNVKINWYSQSFIRINWHSPQEACQPAPENSGYRIAKEKHCSAHSESATIFKMNKKNCNSAL